MSTRRFTALLARVAALATVLATFAAAPAHAGPPWISIELPANPLDRTTRGAFLLVHTFHHEQVVANAVTGRAEGIVDGRRRTVELTFDRTSRPGVLALRRSWPTEGQWVLVLTVGGHDNGASAIVSVENDEVRLVRVPTRDGQPTFPRPVTRDDIDGALRALAAADRPEHSEEPSLALLGLATIPLSLAGLALRRR